MIPAESRMRGIRNVRFDGQGLEGDLRGDELGTIGAQADRMEADRFVCGTVNDSPNALYRRDLPSSFPTVITAWRAAYVGSPAEYKSRS